MRHGENGAVLTGEERGNDFAASEDVQDRRVDRHPAGLFGPELEEHGVVWTLTSVLLQPLLIAESDELIGSGCQPIVRCGRDHALAGTQSGGVGPDSFSFEDHVIGSEATEERVGRGLSGFHRNAWLRERGKEVEVHMKQVLSGE